MAFASKQQTELIEDSFQDGCLFVPREGGKVVDAGRIQANLLQAVDCRACRSHQPTFKDGSSRVNYITVPEILILVDRDGQHGRGH
jgi:hypothetical protein